MSNDQELDALLNMNVDADFELPEADADSKPLEDGTDIDDIENAGGYLSVTTSDGTDVMMSTAEYSQYVSEESKNEVYELSVGGMDNVVDFSQLTSGGTAEDLGVSEEVFNAMELIVKNLLGAIFAPTIKVKITDLENGKMPTYATDGSAALDLYATKTLDIPHGQKSMMPLGFAMQLPKTHVALIVPRSGFGVKGLVLKNTIGVIDSDYRGIVHAPLTFTDQQKPFFTVEAGDRVAQMLIIPVALAQVLQVFELDETQRGAGGFGSTGAA